LTEPGDLFSLARVPDESQQPFAWSGDANLDVLACLRVFAGELPFRQSAERLRAVRNLREDMPVLWPHLSPTQQRESADDLDEVLRRASQQEIRRELQALRQQLVPR
jgi:hypothetical protein